MNRLTRTHRPQSFTTGNTQNEERPHLLFRQLSRPSSRSLRLPSRSVVGEDLLAGRPGLAARGRVPIGRLAEALGDPPHVPDRERDPAVPDPVGQAGRRLLRGLGTQETVELSIAIVASFDFFRGRAEGLLGSEGYGGG